MRQLKQKNLPKAMETINKQNFQSEQSLINQLRLNSKLELNQPKISDSELYDIQKYANSGVNQNQFGVDTSDARSKSQATTMLLDTKYSVRDELMSTISQNQKERSVLGKRSRVTTNKIMKDA